jgi:hypothetical protein
VRKKAVRGGFPVQTSLHDIAVHTLVTSHMRARSAKRRLQDLITLPSTSKRTSEQAILFRRHELIYARKLPGFFYFLLVLLC